MIIKAGTYRFNDTIITPSDTITLNIPFTISVEYMGMVAKASLNRITIGADEITMVMANIINNEAQQSNFIVEGNNALPFYYLFPYYNSNWSDCKYSDEADLFAALTNIKDMPYDVSGIGQTFTITEDTEVNDTSSYAWFTSNTTMLIKAGTYRWNDDISDFPDDTEFNLNFTTPTLLTDKIDTSTDEYSITFSDGASNFNKIQIQDSIRYFMQTSESGGGAWYDVYAYPEEIDGVVYGWKWNSCGEFAKLMGFTVIGNYDGFGQIITVTEDTYVPTNFGLFATSNWQPYTEPTPTENITITITYKGSPIITITNGVMLNADGEPVTKATIPTESYKLDSNIELTITKS